MSREVSYRRNDCNCMSLFIHHQTCKVLANHQLVPNSIAAVLHHKLLVQFLNLNVMRAQLCTVANTLMFVKCTKAFYDTVAV